LEATSTLLIRDGQYRSAMPFDGALTDGQSHSASWVLVSAMQALERGEDFC
jgi:hypothetical protein